jgi:predicted DNA-binding protein YlxM (UPF0122 family)
MAKKDTLKDALKMSGLWQHQYEPRLRIIRKIHQDDKALLDKLKKATTSQKMRVIDNLQARGFFDRF